MPLLAVMAYDRYAAVCQPLHYTVIMHPELCQKMVLIAWFGGLGSALILCSLTLKLLRCGHREVDNFFCEMPALIKMACVYSKVIEFVVFALGWYFSGTSVTNSHLIWSHHSSCHENQVSSKVAKDPSYMGVPISQ